MEIEKKATQIFNLFWLSIGMITRKKAVELSIIHVNGIIEALREIELPVDKIGIILEKIEEYEKVKEVIQSFKK